MKFDFMIRSVYFSAVQKAKIIIMLTGSCFLSLSFSFKEYINRAISMFIFYLPCENGLIKCHLHRFFPLSIRIYGIAISLVPLKWKLTMTSTTSSQPCEKETKPIKTIRANSVSVDAIDINRWFQSPFLVGV